VCVNPVVTFDVWTYIQTLFLVLKCIFVRLYSSYLSIRVTGSSLFKVEVTGAINLEIPCRKKNKARIRKNDRKKDK